MPLELNLTARKEGELHCPRCNKSLTVGDGEETPPLFCRHCWIGWSTPEEVDQEAAFQHFMDESIYQALIVIRESLRERRWGSKMRQRDLDFVSQISKVLRTQTNSLYLTRQYLLRRGESDGA